jgi:hypothetical protein
MKYVFMVVAVRVLWELLMRKIVHDQRVDQI